MNINKINLQYLTNPYEMNKIHKDTSFNLVEKEDFDFYKARILKMTKDILKEKEVDNTIKNSFINYSKVCIDHFKFIDKRDIIQNEYDMIEKNKKKENKFNIDESNNIIMKKRQVKKLKITDQIPIKTNITPEKVVMPKKRKINLK
uniref:Uncharacterized protein n=1 Tax=viral metagenome TaxID=1070528 RepID=A0A6C0C0E8_9ZZZZ